MDFITSSKHASAKRCSSAVVRFCIGCGTKIEARDLRPSKARRRIYVYCGDPLGTCPFSQGDAIREGLPVLTVDEESVARTFQSQLSDGDHELDLVRLRFGRENR